MRRFSVTVEPLWTGAARPDAAATAPAAAGTPVFSTFAGTVEVVDVLVKVGDVVQSGAVIVQVEAMKAKHDIRTPAGGRVLAVHIKIGDEIDSRRPVISLG